MAKNHDGTQLDHVTAAVESVSGGFLIGAFSNSDTSANKTKASAGGDFWLINLDDFGNIEWQNTIDGELSEQPKDNHYI